MQIDEFQKGSTLVFKLTGDLDSFSVAILKERMNRNFETGNYSLVIDLSNVEFMDSAGLGQLVAGLKYCIHNGGDLVLVGINDTIRELLRITKLDTVFKVYQSEEDALAGKSG